MDDLQQITAELSGKTNFDAEHEGDLFERIAIIEKQEAAGELIPGLNKVDHILIAAMFIVHGVLPVIWYAITYA